MEGEEEEEKKEEEEEEEIIFIPVRIVIGKKYKFEDNKQLERRVCFLTRFSEPFK